MRKVRVNRGVLLATAATLMLTSTAFAVSSDVGQVKPVKCFGANSCKGQGQCGAKGQNGCAGQNNCKGQSWIYLSSTECQAKGGKIVGVPIK